MKTTALFLFSIGKATGDHNAIQLQIPRKRRKQHVSLQNVPDGQGACKDKRNTGIKAPEKNRTGNGYYKEAK